MKLFISTVVVKLLVISFPMDIIINRLKKLHNNTYATSPWFLTICFTWALFFVKLANALSAPVPRESSIFASSF